MNLSKTRLAPTPSGFLHLGNIYSFAVTAGLAKQTGAKILLRIDDVDRERTNKKFVQEIFDTLNFLEIPWDEGPRNMEEYENEFSQMRRMGIYRAALQQLRDNGKVFACTCSRSQFLGSNPDGGYQGTCRHKNISLDAEHVCWRLFTDRETVLSVRKVDEEAYVETRLPADMTDFVVRKKDGFPAYQLTSLVDDMHFGVDLVVRGQDLWHSTLAQQYLATKLGYDRFKDVGFYHHPLIAGSDGLKLSKSAGATSVQYLHDHGKSPAAIYAMIAEMLNIAGNPRTWHELVALM